MGVNDAFVRILVGFIVLAFVFVGPKIGWGWLGLIGVVSGFARWCPLYGLLGISTADK